MEKRANGLLKELSPAQWEILWKEAKEDIKISDKTAKGK